MLTIKQKFFVDKKNPARVGRTREDDVYGGMFYVANEVLKSPQLALLRRPSWGKQNCRRGTIAKAKRVAQRKARKRNRTHR
jgi:hypothetical protein